MNNNYNLEQLTPASVFKVAILGAESTGKTTLCRDLAEHFESLWVGEYMRRYLQDKWDTEQLSCTWDDLLPIAQGQIALENKLTLQTAQNSRKVGKENTEESNPQKYLFCDTSLFELMVYSNWYYNDFPPALTQAALSHHYDLILLTEVDTPWVADDLRDSPHQRKEIDAYFEKYLNKYNKDFRRIGGDRKERILKVAQWFDNK